MKEFFSYRSKSFSGADLILKAQLICENHNWEKIDEGADYIVYMTPRSMSNSKQDISIEVVNDNLNIYTEPHNPAFPGSKNKVDYIRSFIRAFQGMDEE